MTGGVCSKGLLVLLVESDLQSGAPIFQPEGTSLSGGIGGKWGYMAR